jgi:hypothetical protein
MAPTQQKIHSTSLAQKNIIQAPEFFAYIVNAKKPAARGAVKDGRRYNHIHKI